MESFVNYTVHKSLGIILTNGASPDLWMCRSKYHRIDRYYWYYRYYDPLRLSYSTVTVTKRASNKCNRMYAERTFLHKVLHGSHDIVWKSNEKSFSRLILNEVSLKKFDKICQSLASVMNSLPGRIILHKIRCKILYVFWEPYMIMPDQTKNRTENRSLGTS